MKSHMAHRIILLLAFATLLASIVGNQSIMLDTLVIIFFAAAIITRLAPHFKRHMRKSNGD